MGVLRGWHGVKWTERRKDVRSNEMQSNMMEKRGGKEQDSGEGIRPMKGAKG